MRGKKLHVARSIVCGVDGSTNSAVAITVAARMAERLGLRLVLAHVVEYVDPPYAAAGAVSASRATLTTLDDQVRAGERLLTQMAEQGGVEQAEQRVVPGFAGERLADLADDEEAELLVVGSRGRGALKAALLGSVSTNLISVARVPVLVVPPGVRTD